MTSRHFITRQLARAGDSFLSPLSTLFFVCLVLSWLSTSCDFVGAKKEKKFKLLHNASLYKQQERGSDVINNHARKKRENYSFFRRISKLDDCWGEKAKNCSRVYRELRRLSADRTRYLNETYALVERLEFVWCYYCSMTSHEQHWRFEIWLSIVCRLTIFSLWFHLESYVFSHFYSIISSGRICLLSSVCFLYLVRPRYAFFFWRVSDITNQWFWCDCTRTFHPTGSSRLSHSGKLYSLYLENSYFPIVVVVLFFWYHNFSSRYLGD